MFVDGLDLAELGFEGTTAAATGRAGYRPVLLLKIYIYGYLNRIQSSRRLEREAQRNVELIWLTGRLSPDFKTIPDFRHDNGQGIRNVCKRFVALCRQLDLFSQAVVAIDGSKFKAINNRDNPDNSGIGWDIDTERPARAPLRTEATATPASACCLPGHRTRRRRSVPTRAQCVG